MRHLASIVVLGIAFGSTESAQAQRGPMCKGPPHGGNVDVRRLVAELDTAKDESRAARMAREMLVGLKRPATAAPRRN